MAAGFLLADREFKESWETHREGMFGSDLVAARYPAGMVIEIMAAHGHDMTKEIDAFQAFAAANGFRYFDHPSSGIDTDTLGVYLRLCAHTPHGTAALAAARPVLGCLERNIRERGEVPVWLHACADVPAPERHVLDLGEGCATVAAHLLLGLSTSGSAQGRAMLELGARDLLGRVVERGLGANVNYPPVYALATLLRLLVRLEAAPVSVDVVDLAATVMVALLAELERRARARVLTAQDAALLSVACLEAKRRDLIDPAWATLILQQQRFDGSWRGEPFFAAPNRGRHVTWYESSILTSAMCYDALVRSSGRA